MRIKEILYVYLSTSLLVSVAYGMDLPAIGHWESKMSLNGRKIDKMYGYVDVTIDKSRKATVNVKFSNGQQLSGGHLTPEYRLTTRIVSQ